MVRLPRGTAMPPCVAFSPSGFGAVILMKSLVILSALVIVSETGDAVLLIP